MSRPVAWSVEELLDRLGLASGVPIPAVPIGQDVPAPIGASWGLTGATGWWGRHAARALLRAEAGHALVVPVRAPDAATGLARVQAAWAPTPALREEAARSGWWDRTRVVALADLASTPLPQERGLHGIIHAAADLSLANGLEGAWGANVTATQQAWRWALASGARRFDHLSTLSVWVAGNTPAGWVHETDNLRRAERLWGGYAASKWAAEAWLSHQAVSAATPPCLSVHRLGLLSHSASEGWAPGDGLAASARAWARWGRPEWAVPMPGDAVDWSPVDRVVAGVLGRAQAGEHGPFHLAARTPIPAADWLAALARRWGDAPGEWPILNPAAKAAHRAFGRWSAPGLAPTRWWHDVFQSDRHRYGVRPHREADQWDWTRHDLDAALADLDPPRAP